MHQIKVRKYTVHAYMYIWMCPGLRDRWLHKKVLSLQNFNIYAPTT